MVVTPIDVNGAVPAIVAATPLVDRGLNRTPRAVADRRAKHLSSGRDDRDKGKTEEKGDFHGEGNLCDTVLHARFHLRATDSHLP